MTDAPPSTKKRRMNEAALDGGAAKSDDSQLQPAAASATLTVVQSGSAGYGTCLLLRTPGGAYLFNAPESVQRLLGEHAAPLGKVHDVFLTRSAAAAAAGLPGLALSLQAAGVRRLRVHGPRNGATLFAAVRPYAEQRLELDVQTVPWDVRHWADGALSVRYVPLLLDDARQASTCADAQAIDDDEKPWAKLVGRSQEGEHEPDGAMVLSRTDAEGRGSDASVAVVYVVTLPPRPPKIDPQKCMKLSVPFGPLIGELQGGRAVTLPDGRRIEPEQVRSDTGDVELATTFLVVDCPTERFVHALHSANQLRQLVDECTGDSKSIQLVAHLSPSDVYHSTKYQEWLKSIPGKPCHLVLNDNAPYLPHSEGVFRLNLQLNYMNGAVYPRLHLHDAICKEAQRLPDDDAKGQIVYAEPYLAYTLRGDQQGFERAEKAEFDESVIIEATEALHGVKHAALMAKNLVPHVESESDRYPEVVMLGTGSAVPNKHRNVSATLVYTDANHAFMVDCGEGTLNQLYTMYGRDGGDAALRALKVSLMTHMHQDHYLGLFAVLQARRRAFANARLDYEPLHVVGSKPLFGIVALYSRLVEPLGDAVRMVSSLRPPPHLIDATARAALLNRITPVQVYHAMMPWAYIVETESGRKLAFSGDCRPDDRLVAAAEHAHLLIHEATFDPARQEDAIRKRHSTTAEAIDVAQRARCDAVLLTHFSARFAKLPIVTDECFGLSAPPAAVASDFMRFSEPRQAAHLHKLIHALKTLFAKEHAAQVSARDLLLLKQSVRTMRDRDTAADAGRAQW